jgi:hypothetical protein
MTARFALLLGGCLVLCAVAPSYPSALVAFFLAGAGNAPFFTATLAARSRYSPPEVRAQVFVFMAAVKVATASAGTALAGAAVGLGPRDLLAARRRDHDRRSADGDPRPPSSVAPASAGPGVPANVNRCWVGRVRRFVRCAGELASARRR